MVDYRRIIFVCIGNTCRSPMAAAIMRNVLEDKGISVDSRGLVVLFPEPYNPKVVAVAANHGITMANNKTTQLCESDFDKHTLVLVMSHEMKQRIYDEYDNAVNVYTLGEFIGDPQQEIEDPYGRGMEEYNDCFEQLSAMIAEAASNILKNINDRTGD